MFTTKTFCMKTTDWGTAALQTKKETPLPWGCGTPSKWPKWVITGRSLTPTKLGWSSKGPTCPYFSHRFTKKKIPTGFKTLLNPMVKGYKKKKHRLKNVMTLQGSWWMTNPNKAHYSWKISSSWCREYFIVQMVSCDPPTKTGWLGFFFGMKSNPVT